MDCDKTIDVNITNKVLVFGADQLDNNLKGYLIKNYKDYNIDETSYIENCGSNQYTTFQLMYFIEECLDKNNNYFKDNPNHLIVIQIAPRDRKTEYVYKQEQYNSFMHIGKFNNNDKYSCIDVSKGTIPLHVVAMFGHVAKFTNYDGFNFMVLFNDVLQLHCYLANNNVNHIFYDPNSYFLPETIEKDCEEWDYLQEEIQLYKEIAPEYITTGDLKDVYFYLEKINKE